MMPVKGTTLGLGAGEGAAAHAVSRRSFIAATGCALATLPLQNVRAWAEEAGDDPSEVAAGVESSASTGTAVIGVVNFQPVWGDVEANIASMSSYIEQAADQGVQLLVFPEMAANGFCYSEDIDSEQSRWAVESAETVDGPTATAIASLSKRYGMWVVYGMSEVFPEDESLAYNSAFICSPKGEVSTYRKINACEGAWCKGAEGREPAIIETDFGKVGVSICFDTYANPEIQRFYAAQGCRFLVNPTATSRGCFESDDGTLDSSTWQWYYANRLETIASRDGLVVVSANNAGRQFDPSGDQLFNFCGGSVVVAPVAADSVAEGAAPVAYLAGAPDNQEPGLLVATVDLGALPAMQDYAVNRHGFCPDVYEGWYETMAREATPDVTPTRPDDDPIVVCAPFQPVTDDVEANVATMDGLVANAAAQGACLVVFPELAVQGCRAADEADSPSYRDADDLALEATGDVVSHFSQIACDFGLTVAFGASERLDTLVDDSEAAGTDQAYNSYFVCTADGEVVSYRKVHPTKDAWCAAGKDPLIVELPFGKVGFALGRDTYDYPELARYYGAMGCSLYVHAGTDEDAEGWEYLTRLEYVADQEKMCLATVTYTDARIMAPLRKAENGTFLRSCEDGALPLTDEGVRTGFYDISTYDKTFDWQLYANMYGVLAGNKSMADVASTPRGSF